MIFYSCISERGCPVKYINIALEFESSVEHRLEVADIKVIILISIIIKKSRENKRVGIKPFSNVKTVLLMCLQISENLTMHKNHIKKHSPKNTINGYKCDSTCNGLLPSKQINYIRRNTLLLKSNVPLVFCHDLWSNQIKIFKKHGNRGQIEISKTERQ